MEDQIPHLSPHPEEKPPGCPVLGRGPLTKEGGWDRGSSGQMRCSRWALAESWESLGSLWTSRGWWLQQGLREKHKAGPVSFPWSPHAGPVWL